MSLGRSTPLGLFFLLLGTGAFVIALLEKPIAVVVLCIATGVLVFGALMIDYDHAKAGLSTLWTYASEILPGRRSSSSAPADPK
jgi:hypothetical protein